MRVPAPPAGIKVRRIEEPPERPPAGDGIYRKAPALTGTRVEITRRWFGPTHLFMLLFCVFWDAGVGSGYAAAISKGDWGFLLFSLLHLGAGVWLTYFTIAGLLNRTWIGIASGTLTIRHGPLPWRGNRTLDRDDIRALHARTKPGRKGHISHTLNAVLKGGTEITLLNNLSSAEQSLYLERVIKEELGFEEPLRAGEEGEKKRLSESVPSAEKDLYLERVAEEERGIEEALAAAEEDRKKRPLR